ncbi:hypothetical protein IWX50DRAFT_7293 [Phyllosticta citricarpa]
MSASAFILTKERPNDLSCDVDLPCVLEMITVLAKDWGRHLDSRAILPRAANITVVSGGVNQALFWCYARMLSVMRSILSISVCCLSSTFISP